MSKTPKGPPDWYRLDNAGVLYSALQREKYSPVYRFSAVLSQPVDPAVLQRAVDRTMPRFPGFRVRMKPGVFWHYFEPNDSPGPFVRPDMSNPCQPIRFREDNGWLVRFFYYQSRISLEVFHAVSDGAGALTFFRTLLAVYLRELGHPIPCGPGLLDVDAPPRPEELEDAYARYAGKRVLRDRWQETAFSNTSQAEPFYTLNVTMGFLPVDRLRLHHRIPLRSAPPVYPGESGGPAPPPSQARGSGHSHRSPGLVPLRHPPQLHPHCPALRGPHPGALHLP